MTMELVTISVMFFTIFLVILIAALKDQHDRKNNAHLNSDEWLFSNWKHKTYNALFSNKKPEDVAKKMGFELEKYIHSCRLTKTPIDLESIIMLKITGLFIIVVAFLSYIVFKNLVFVLILICFGAVIYMYPGRQVMSMAVKRRRKVIEELPRFMDLLQTALYINLPIDTAITTTVKYLDNTILKEEFEEAMTTTMIGASSWQNALTRIAADYEIDVFSDFVMDLILSYEKGLSIYEVVKNQNKEIKQSNLLAAKESATKLNSKMLVPIVIFKIIPLIAFFLVPIVVKLKDSFV